MKKSRFSEEQMVRILREAARSGRCQPQVARNGVRDGTRLAMFRLELLRMAAIASVGLGCSPPHSGEAASHPVAPSEASSQPVGPEEVAEPVESARTRSPIPPPKEEEFFRSFVAAYRSGKRRELVALSPDSKGVILLDNWNGLRVSGSVFPSLQALLEDGNMIAAPPELFPGEFVDGPWLPATKRPSQRCPWQPRGPVVFGKLSDTTYFFEWGGTKIDYGDPESHAAAKAIAKQATHFVYSTSSNFGFVFARSEETWFLVGIDRLATDC